MARSGCGCAAVGILKSIGTLCYDAVGVIVIVPFVAVRGMSKGSNGAAAGRMARIGTLYSAAGGGMRIGIGRTSARVSIADAKGYAVVCLRIWAIWIH